MHCGHCSNPKRSGVRGARDHDTAAQPLRSTVHGPRSQGILPMTFFCLTRLKKKSWGPLLDCVDHGPPRRYRSSAARPRLSCRNQPKTKTMYTRHLETKEIGSVQQALVYYTQMIDKMADEESGCSPGDTLHWAEVYNRAKVILQLVRNCDKITLGFNDDPGPSAGAVEA